MQTALVAVDAEKWPIFGIGQPIPLTDEAVAAMVARARLLDELLRYNPEPSVAEVRRRWPAADAFLPMMACGKPMTVLINREAAAVVAVVDLQPWE